MLKDAFPWCAEWEAELKRLFGAYVEAKQQQQVLDYDDLLLYWAGMVAEPALRRRSARASTTCWLTNTRTPTCCRPASCARSSPTAAASPWSATTPSRSTRSAAPTVRNILDFPGQFSQPARIVTLERNYRSTQPILDVSNAVIAAAAERHAKTLWTDKVSAGRPQLVLVPDEAQQARFVCERVLAQREGAWR